MTAFYQFVEHRYWVGAGEVVGVGPVEVITRHFTEEQLTKAFGGYLTYADREGRRYIGVWGQAKVDRLVAALKHLNVTVDVVEERPPLMELRQRVG